MIFLQGFDDGKKFEFDYSVPCLGVSEFVTVEGKGMVLLLEDNSTNLFGGGISVDVKGLLEVQISKDDLLGEEVLQLVKGGLTVRGP